MSDLPPVADADTPSPRTPRLRTADRQQLLPAMPLEDLLDTDHQARLVWDFVVGLDRVLTHSVAVLREQDLVDLNRVAQDGLRVRASAGAASFRRRPTLQECLAEAQEQVQRLKQELEDDPAAPGRRRAAAHRRA